MNKQMRFVTSCRRVARSRWPLLLALALGLLCAAPVHAQAPPAAVIYSQLHTFQIPFETDPGERRIQQVELYVSTDQGRNWTAYATGVPDATTSKGYFRFTAVRDGLYWFSVRTRDHQGQLYPATLDALRPGLRVIVDTQKPIVSLQPLPPQSGQVGVSWDIRDDNLDPASLRLEYRIANSVEWQNVPIEVAAATGQRSWNPGTNATLEVRLRARDRADNWGEQTIPVTPGASGGGNLAPAVPPPPPPPTADPNVRMVNSKHISLDYDIQEVGPSGVIVELWYTQDGRSWQKYKEQRDPPKPYIFTFDVAGEGLYGFTLVVRSGVGLGGRPPQVGDTPQVWVEVDLTAPTVQVMNVDVGRGQDAGNLTILWTARDKNLARQPINISYCEQPGGPWTPIATQVENTGRYVWRMPPQGVPFKFRVRVDAIDRAGNTGNAEWNQDVIVDLKVPKINIINVTPVTK
jgi:hypothetical protein